MSIDSAPGPAIRKPPLDRPFPRCYGADAGVALRLAPDSALPLATNPLRGDATRLSVSGGPLRQPDALNTAELASLWHLPSDTGKLPGGNRVALFGVSRQVPNGALAARQMPSRSYSHTPRSVPD